MNDTTNEKRMAGNEAVFREYNERVQQGVEAVNKIAQEDNQQHLMPRDETPLHYHCECSDENCQQRIKMRPSRYKEIHLHRNRFIVVCGHEVPGVEEVIEQYKHFYIVQKFKAPPESVPGLQPTNVDNA